MSIEMTTEFQQALELLNSGKNLFLTGKAGTGKSTLINHYKKNTDRNVVVAAPTGVAALNVGGYTIHRLFSYSPHTTLEEIKCGKARPGRFAGVLKKLDTLIIDEASMVRADLFDQLVTSLEMYGPHPGEPYGGVQVVLVGDLYQLPPVVGSYEEGWFFKNYETPFFFSAKTFVRTDFPVVQLSKVFRQIGDSTLVDLLNSIREGRMSTAVSYALNQRTQEQFTPPLDEYWLTLASTNRSVDKRNREALEELPGELFESHAIVEGQEDGFDEPTKRILHLKIGAQVMLLNNDSSRRWVNGSIGTVQKITSGDDGLTVEVLLNNGKTVEVTPHRWEITRPRLVGGNLQHDVIGAFTQLPMKLAWAITIHKSQGQTLERAVIDLKSGTRAPGQLYVALSRCTSLDGLVLTRNIAPRDVKIDHRVHRFLLESREECSTDRCFIEGLYVGEEDGFIRPIEIALGVDDDEPITTLINPSRDVGNAAKKYGLSASDLQIAPTLNEAWAFIEAEIFEKGLISSRGDELVNILDTELKRNGLMTGIQMIAAPRQCADTSVTCAADLIQCTRKAVTRNGLGQ